MSAFRVLVKNLVKESFDITFMGNEKSCQNINQFFSFLIKIFFNWILNQCSKNTPQHNPFVLMLLECLKKISVYVHNLLGAYQSPKIVSLGIKDLFFFFLINNKNHYWIIRTHQESTFFFSLTVINTQNKERKLFIYLFL